MAPPLSGLKRSHQPPRFPPSGGSQGRTGPHGFTVRYGFCVIRVHTAPEAAHLVSLLGLRMTPNTGRLPAVDRCTQTEPLVNDADGALDKFGPPTCHGAPCSVMVEQSKSKCIQGWVMVNGRWSKQPLEATLDSSTGVTPDSSACGALGLLAVESPSVKGRPPALGHFQQPPPPPTPPLMFRKRTLLAVCVVSVPLVL